MGYWNLPKKETEKVFVHRGHEQIHADLGKTYGVRIFAVPLANTHLHIRVSKTIGKSFIDAEDSS